MTKGLQKTAITYAAILIALAMLSACSAMEPITPRLEATAPLKPMPFAGYWKTWKDESASEAGSFDAYDIYIHVSQNGVAKGYIIAGNNCTQEGEVEWGQVSHDGVFKHDKDTLEEFDMSHLTSETWSLESEGNLVANGESILLNEDGSPSTEKEVYSERYMKTSQAEYELLRQTCLE